MDTNEEQIEPQNGQNTAELVPKSLLVLNTIIVLFIISMFFLIYGVINQPKNSPLPVTETLVFSNAFENLELRAKAVYVYDVMQHKVIYEKNQDLQLPLASLTKLMTALTAADLIPLNSRVTIRKEFLEEEGDSGLFANESWNLKDLLDFSLIVSSNDGARSIASVVGALDLKTEDYDLGRKDFINKMNMKAGKLDLKQTYFINESGLDVGSTSGGYGTAKDMAKLLQYIIVNKPGILEATTYDTLTVNSSSEQHVAKNTNIDIESIPGLIASKTGYTELAGGNLAIAFDTSIGRPVIIVVLGSTMEGRFEDVAKLVKASLESVAE